MSHKTRLLFICTHNSARSQMAEGLVNRILADSHEASSAGTKPGNVHPMAIKAMVEIGIDISSQRSKDLSEFKGQGFDYVVTLCSDAEEICPFFPGKEHVHRSFSDPSAVRGSDEEVLAAFRRSRDEIRDWIEATYKGRVIANAQ